MGRFKTVTSRRGIAILAADEPKALIKKCGFSPIDGQSRPRDDEKEA